MWEISRDRRFQKGNLRSLFFADLNIFPLAPAAILSTLRGKGLCLPFPGGLRLWFGSLCPAINTMNDPFSGRGRQFAESVAVFRAVAIGPENTPVFFAFIVCLGPDKLPGNLSLWGHLKNEAVGATANQGVAVGHAVCTTDIRTEMPPPFNVLIYPRIGHCYPKPLPLFEC